MEPLSWVTAWWAWWASSRPVDMRSPWGGGRPDRAWWLTAEATLDGLDSWLMTGASDDLWSSRSFWVLAVYSWQVDAGTDAAMTDTAEASEALTADNLLTTESTDFSPEMAADWDDEWHDHNETNKNLANKQKKKNKTEDAIWAWPPESLRWLWCDCDWCLFWFSWLLPWLKNWTFWTNWTFAWVTLTNLAAACFDFVSNSLMNWKIHTTTCMNDHLSRWSWRVCKLMAAIPM